MLLRLLIALFLVFFHAINLFASEMCLPDYMIGQVTYKLPSCDNNIVIRRDSESFYPPSGQCLMYNDVVSVKGSCVARIVTDAQSYHIGPNYNVQTWNAPQKKIVHSTLHDDSDFVRIVTKLFEAQTISKRAVSQGMNDECLDQNSNSVALTPLRNFPPGIQKIGDDIRELTVGWKGNTGIGFVEVSLKRGNSDAPSFASRVCWKSWTTISLPNDLKPGEQLVLKAVDAYDTSLQWHIEVCAADELPSTPAASNNDEMVGLWRLLKAPSEYRLDALSRINRDASELVAPRGMLNAVLADIPLPGSK